MTETTDDKPTPDTPQAKPAVETQNVRRVKYGFNVLISIVLAVAIAAMLNVLAYNRLFKIRFDLTRTGFYTLSDQTEQVLDNLDGDYRIVTLLAGTDPSVAEGNRLLRDFVDLYAEGSTRVQAQHIDPSRPDVAEPFLDQLKARYADEIDEHKAAIDEGRTALADLRSQSSAYLQTLDTLINTPGMPKGNEAAIIDWLSQRLKRFESEQAEFDGQIAGALDDPLPDYRQIVALLQGRLGELDSRTFAVALDYLDRLSKNRLLDSAARNQVLTLVDQLKAGRTIVSTAVERLSMIQGPSDYSTLLTQLAQQNTVLVLGEAPEQVRVLQRTEIFPPQAEPSEDSAQSTPFFLGEERLTGAMVALEQTHQPMAVFVSTSGDPVIGQAGNYRHVGQRLEAMNYEVRTWLPGPQNVDPRTGQPLGPSRPPEPAPDQPVVWILASMPPQRALNPQAMQTQGQAIEHVRKRLDAGDSVLMLVGRSPLAMGASVDELVELAKPMGIEPMVDRIVMREVVDSERGNRVVAEYIVTQWPDDLAVSQAVQGMSGYIQHYTIPLNLGNDEAGSAKAWPLGHYEDSRLFTLEDLRDKDPRRTEDNQVDQFVFAAAAERDRTRMVVIGAPFWATDDVTAAAQLRGNDLAFMFPANAELFINSVHWLAKLDELIAAGSYTQEISRIEPIPQERHRAMFWTLLVGMPLATAVAGMLVFFVRRRA